MKYITNNQLFKNIKKYNLFMRPRTTTPKHAGKTAVKQAAEHLILTNGETTTLEVKNWLRKEGYAAFQTEVSRWMFKISQEQDWEFESNGLYRIYRYKLEELSTTKFFWKDFSLN